MSADDEKTDETTTAPSVEQIRADIARDRARLAETVDVLSDRLDVKARARRTVDDARANAASRVAEIRSESSRQVARVQDAATTDDGRPRPEVVGAGAALLVAVGITVFLVLRSRRP